MSCGGCGGYSDIVAHEWLVPVRSVSPRDEPRVERHIRHPYPCGEADPAIIRVRKENIQRGHRALRVEPTVILRHVYNPARCNYCRDEARARGQVVDSELSRPT